MASREDKQMLVRLARQGKMEGDDGFRLKLSDLNKAGIKGPGHDYGLDYSDKPFYRPALWEATWKNHEAIVKLLIEKNATVDWADYQGRTPLHEAAFYGYQNLVELFLEKGHPLDPMDNFGHTPLFRAVEAGRDNIVEMLVDRKASLNILDTDGVTPQHIAGFNGRPDMGQWLLYKGAWKNRFSMEEKPPEVKNRASASLAQDAPKKAPIAEPEAEEAPAAEAGGEKEKEAHQAPKEEAKKEDDAKPTIPRSQFSDP